MTAGDPGRLPHAEPNSARGIGPVGRTDRTDEYVISVGDVLSGDDPEPPPGTVIETTSGARWKRLLSEPETYRHWQWVMTEDGRDYPHTRWQWALVTYEGPVTVIQIPEDTW